jgi:predicted MFS family arabinose efflux permease
MNGGQMAGASAAGLCTAAFGPGWALAVCGAGMLVSVPMLLAIRVTIAARTQESSLLRDLREGWSEFRSHTWLWVTVAQFGVVLMAWYGAFGVLGPVVAKAHLGGPAAWGAITAAESVGLIAGGMLSLRFTPRRPVRFVAIIGASLALAPLSLAMLWPLPLVCLTAFGLGITTEIMMVQWTVVMARNIPADMLARVSGYDLLGSVMAMPAGALIAGPLAAAIGVPATQYGAVVLICAASALALIPRDVRRMRSGDGLPSAPGTGGDQATSSASPVNAAHIAA